MNGLIQDLKEQQGKIYIPDIARFLGFGRNSFYVIVAKYTSQDLKYKGIRLIDSKVNPEVIKKMKIKVNEGLVQSLIKDQNGITPYVEPHEYFIHHMGNPRFIELSCVPSLPEEILIMTQRKFNKFIFKEDPFEGLEGELLEKAQQLVF